MSRFLVSLVSDIAVETLPMTLSRRPIKEDVCVWVFSGATNGNLLIYTLCPCVFVMSMKINFISFYLYCV